MIPSGGAGHDGDALDDERVAGPIDATARKRAAVETFARHEASLRRTAARYSICDDDADEALQRGLEILLLKAPSDNPRELVRWTQTVVKHEALSVRAERERVLSGPAALPVHPTQEDWIALLPSELDGPAERAERDEAVERSREALTTLKPQELRALSLLAEGYSYREIAEITGYSATKVNRCVSEGRERFRRFLVRRDGGARCTELAPLLSAFADDEAATADVATLREHLRTCAHCRAAPHAAAALLPVLPPSRGALVGRLHDAYAAVATRVGGGSGASDSTLGGLASAGGTVPVQALPGVFAAVSHADPLRQILGGVRSILYLEARADAGLAEGAIATAVGLLFWLGFGAFFTRRYDKAGRDRLDPDLLAYVHESADAYRDQHPPAGA